jgi:hypothetical protein
VSEGGPRPSGDGDAGLDVDRIPPEPSVLISALARALAALHDGGPTDLDGGATAGERMPEMHLRPVDALELVRDAVAAGWEPPVGSPFAPIGAERLVEVLRDGVVRATARSDGPVPTIGRATFANLVLPRTDDASAALSGATNITFRRSTRRTDPPHFARCDDAAWSDPYRDLAVAAADVVVTFGPGAVLGFTTAYVEARPLIEPLDPIRLDWWSLVAAVIGSDRGDPGGPMNAGHADDGSAGSGTDGT